MAGVSRRSQGEEQPGAGSGSKEVVYERELPARVAVIPQACAEVLTAIGYPADDVLGNTALSEALLNAIVHGALSVEHGEPGQRDVTHLQRAIAEAEARAGAEASVRVVARRSGDGHEVVITDPGRGFNWRQALARLDELELDPLREDGRGLLLIRSACKAFEYNASGNQLTLSFTPHQAVEAH